MKKQRITLGKTERENDRMIKTKNNIREGFVFLLDDNMYVQNVKDLIRNKYYE